jgi:hypothetical protein
LANSLGWLTYHIETCKAMTGMNSGSEDRMLGDSPVVEVFIRHVWMLVVSDGKPERWLRRGCRHVIVSSQLFVPFAVIMAGALTNLYLMYGKIPG